MVVSYGRFIQTVIDFTIIALVIFMAVKLINRLKRQAEADPVEVTVSVPATPSNEELLLAEIRDLLKK